MRAHLVEQVEERDLLRAREPFAVVNGVDARRGVEREGGQRRLRAQKARPAVRFVHQRLQQMAAATACFPPDVEGPVGYWAGCERTVEFAQTGHQFVVAGGEEIIEGGERRRAEIERQLALHGQSVPSGRILKSGALSMPMPGLCRGERR